MSKMEQKNTHMHNTEKLSVSLAEVVYQAAVNVF